MKKVAGRNLQPAKDYAPVPAAPLVRSDTWLRGAVAALVLLVAGWMVFDAVQSFFTGDYVTAAEGAQAGRLGPWADLVGALGLDPRSAAMKVFFIAFGTAWLAAAGAFLARVPGARRVLLGFTAASLWYLVVGTLLSLLAIVLLTRRTLARADDSASDRSAGPTKP